MRRGPEHLGKGIVERRYRVTVPDKATEVILYCGAAIVQRWRRTFCSRWATRMSVDGRPAGRAWKESGAPWNSDGDFTFAKSVRRVGAEE